MFVSGSKSKVISRSTVSASTRVELRPTLGQHWSDDVLSHVAHFPSTEGDESLDSGSTTTETNVRYSLQQPSTTTSRHPIPAHALVLPVVKEKGNRQRMSHHTKRSVTFHDTHTRSFSSSAVSPSLAGVSGEHLNSGGYSPPYLFSNSSPQFLLEVTNQHQLQQFPPNTVYHRSPSSCLDASLMFTPSHSHSQPCSLSASSSRHPTKIKSGHFSFSPNAHVKSADSACSRDCASTSTTKGSFWRRWLAALLLVTSITAVGFVTFESLRVIRTDLFMDDDHERSSTKSHDQIRREMDNANAVTTSPTQAAAGPFLPPPINQMVTGAASLQNALLTPRPSALILEETSVIVSNNSLLALALPLKDVTTTAAIESTLSVMRHINDQDINEATSLSKSTPVSLLLASADPSHASTLPRPDEDQSAAATTEQSQPRARVAFPNASTNALGYVKVLGLTDPLFAAAMMYDEIVRIHEPNARAPSSGQACGHHINDDWCAKTHENDNGGKLAPHCALAFPLGDLPAAVIEDSNGGESALTIDLVYTFVNPVTPSFSEFMAERKTRRGRPRHLWLGTRSRKPTQSVVASTGGGEGSTSSHVHVERQTATRRPADDSGADFLRLSRWWSSDENSEEVVPTRRLMRRLWTKMKANAPELFSVVSEEKSPSEPKLDAKIPFYRSILEKLSLLLRATRESNTSTRGDFASNIKSLPSVGDKALHVLREEILQMLHGTHSEELQELSGENRTADLFDQHPSLSMDHQSPVFLLSSQCLLNSTEQQTEINRSTLLKGTGDRTVSSYSLNNEHSTLSLALSNVDRELSRSLVSTAQRAGAMSHLWLSLAKVTEQLLFIEDGNKTNTTRSSSRYRADGLSALARRLREHDNSAVGETENDSPAAEILSTLPTNLPNGGVDGTISDQQRYRDWDEILYSLRGNYYNLMGGPRWDTDAAGSERKGADGEALGNRPSTVRNIYIVLADKDQAPAWLRFRGDSATTAPPSAFEREFIDRIVLVEHRELVPLHLQASVLPTFNSYVIESLLHRIPGLSRHYIYFNNDMLLARPVSFFDYFQPYVVYPGRDAANANAVPEVRWLPLIMVDRLQKVRCTKSRDRCTFYRDPLYTNHLAWMRQAFDWDAVIKNRPQLSFEKRTPTMPFLYYSHFPHLIDRHIMGRLMEGSQYDPKTCVGTSPHLNITKEKGVALKGVDFFADKVRAMHLDAEEKGLGFRNVEGDVFPVLVYNHYQLILRHGGDMTAVGRVLEGVGTYNSAAFGDFAKGKLSDPRFPPCNPAEGGAMPDSGLEVRTHNEHANVQRYPVGDPTGDETAFFDCYGRERRTLLSHLALLSQTFRGSQLKGSGSEKDERISGLSSTFAYPHKLVARSSVLKNSDESPERVLIREFWEIATIIANSTLSSKIPIRFFKVNRELTNHSVSVPISSYFLKEKRKVADTCRANETQFVTDTVGLEPRFSAVSLHLDKKCRSSHVVASLVPKQVMEIQNVTLATPLLVLPLYRARAYRTNGHRGSYDHWLHDWAGSVSGTPLTLASSVRCYFGMMTHIPPPTYKNGTTAAPKPRQTTYGDVMPRRGRVLFLTINDDLVAKGSQNIIPGIGTMRKLLGFVPPKPLVQTSVPKVEPSPSHLLYVALGGSSSNIRESTQILGEASPGNPSNLSVRELLTDYFLSGDLSKTRVPDERDSVLTSVWSVRGLANLFTDPAFDFASQPRSKQWQIENQVPPSHAKLVGDATRGSVRRRLRMFSAIAFLESEAEKTRAAIGALEVHVSVAPTTTPNVSPVEASGGEMLTLIYQEFAPPYPAPWERSKTGRRKRRV